MIRVLLVGCGDVAMRFADLLAGRARLVGLTRRADDVAKLRLHGVAPIVGDLDALRSLERLRFSPDAVMHFAPPPAEGRGDPRTGRLIAALSAARRIPRRFVYVSTSGVYGDCAGARIDESRPRRATSARARRRVDAEDRLRAWAVQRGVVLAIVRAPGIYAEDRLPIERIKQQTPALVAEQDVYTNHIHADDLARVAIAALFRGRANRAYHASDDAELRMGQWFDVVADAHGLPRPPRITRDEAEQRIAPALLSFMSESRRLSNRRMKRELRVKLRYATPQAMLEHTASRGPRRQMPFTF